MDVMALDSHYIVSGLCVNFLLPTGQSILKHINKINSFLLLQTHFYNTFGNHLLCVVCIYLCVVRLFIILHDNE